MLGAQPWRGQRHMNIESMFEYGSRAGFWRLWRLFTARNIPVTVYGVATALARNPEAVAAMREAGWEIASHGLKWIDYKDFSREDEAAHMREAIRLHTEATGERPFGWYTGRSSAQTLALVLADGGFLYSSDSYADDLPYWVRGADRPPHLIIPYTLDANDMRFINPQGFEERRRLFRLLARQLRCALRRRRARAENDVHRASLSACRATRPCRRSDPFPGLHRRASRRCGSLRGSTSRITGIASTTNSARPRGWLGEALEHVSEKWKPVFRKRYATTKESRALPDST